MKQPGLRTPLAKVRGLGSAKDSTSHFIWQRITAIALIPLTWWFISSLLKMAVGDHEQIVLWLGSGMHAALLSLMLLALFYHSKLGLQVVIEDYVHSAFPKYTLLLLNTFIMFGFAAISILAVLKLHLDMVPQGVAG
jgi:succinate dehydrogenase / fumarate reductase membrane anchor subunit